MLLKGILRAALLAALVMPIMAQTSPPPSASAVVEQWRRATHQARRPSARTAHMRYALSQDGLTGTFDEWVTPAGLYRNATDRQFDADAYLLNAHAATLRDWNGYVRTIEGAEARRFRTEAATARVLAFGPSIELEQATVGESADHSAWTLTYTAPGAEAVTWYIDRASGLPQKSVTHGGNDRDVTATYADWRSSDGGLTPFRIGHGGDLSSDTLTMSAAPSFAPMRASDFAALQAGPSDTSMASDTVDVPFTMAANHIIIPVSVNGRAPVGFIFDTGAGDQLISTPRMAEFGVSSYGSTQLEGGGLTQASAYGRDIEFKIAGVTLSRQHASTVDLSGLERLFGVRLGGILGYDFIGRFAIEIDYATRIMRLHRLDTFVYRGAVRPISITVEDGVPYADGVISVPTRPSIPAHFILDFGASDTMILTRPFVQANNLINLASTDRTVQATPGAQQFYTQNNSRGRIDEWRLGPAVQRDIPVSFSANTSGAYGSPDFAGTVGEGIYSRYHVFLDYSRRTLVLEPTAITDQPFRRRSTYGLTVLASEDLSAVIASAVAPNSPAAQQGFQANDAIMSVDGRAVSLEDVRTILSDGGHHAFLVNRGGQRQTLAVDIAAPR